MQKGRVFIISAPSGAGKSTLIKTLMNEVEGLVFSVSHTTRKIRVGEVEDVHYHFVDKEAFFQIVNEDGFLEWAEVYGNHYGTSYKAVQKELDQGRDVILDIDVQGAEQLKTKAFDIVKIFIMPPSIEELRTRLSLRGEPEETINRRIQSAQGEIEKSGAYDYVILNDQLFKAENDLICVVRAERLRKRK